MHRLFLEFTCWKKDLASIYLVFYLQREVTANELSSLSSIILIQAFHMKEPKYVICVPCVSPYQVERLDVNQNEFSVKINTSIILFSRNLQVPWSCLYPSFSHSSFSFFFLPLPPHFSPHPVCPCVHIKRYVWEERAHSHPYSKPAITGYCWNSDINRQKPKWVQHNYQQHTYQNQGWIRVYGICSTWAASRSEVEGTQQHSHEKKGLPCPFRWH